MKLKINFEGSDKVLTNYSQAGQDIFVLICLNGKKNGTFLDLGCNHPININNTYLLEKEFDWKGVSIDIDEEMTKLYHDRKTIFFTEDCTKLNFDKILEYYNSNHIDYLSLDLEPAETTLECLEKIPFDKVEFSVITFEHDRYRAGETCREKSRIIFEKNGYERICSDVKNNNTEYEDWYINPKYVSAEKIINLKSVSKNWNQILF